MEVSGGNSSFFGFGISSTVAMPPWSSSFQRAVTLILRIWMGARLHLAAQAGHAFVTKKLLAARCNVDLLDCRGFTALQVAEQFSSIIVSASGERQPINSKVEPDALQVMKLQGNATIAKLLGSVVLLLGCRVVINGLVAKPELNGV
jgi:hypothetical protein